MLESMREMIHLCEQQILEKMEENLCKMNRNRGSYIEWSFCIKIYETTLLLVSLISYEMATSVRLYLSYGHIMEFYCLQNEHYLSK